VTTRARASIFSPGAPRRIEGRLQRNVVSTGFNGCRSGTGVAISNVLLVRRG
jgi:hypothetical protein